MRWRFCGFSHPRSLAAARELGLEKEHVDIAKRHGRVTGPWASHLAESRKTILEVAERCPGRGRVLVIGAGDCLDVPVAELVRLFGRVTLADVVVGKRVQEFVQAFPGRVEGVNWDATGALAGIAAVRDTLTPEAAPGYFAQAEAGPPPGGEADLIVSANCVSQLGLVPAHALPAYRKDGTLPERCMRAAARRHVGWLQQRSGVRVLLGDAARLDLSPDRARVLKRDTLHEKFGLPKPEKLWRWDLAPIPEWSREFHRVHEVGAWVWGMGGKPGASIVV